MQSSTTLKQLLNGPPSERKLGPFQLVRPLGRGGQAPVWLAREVYGETELRLAAIKLFSLGGDSTDTAPPLSRRGYRARVIEEAKALCRVEHPNITRFYSIASNDAGSVVGVAMEYLTGFSLEARLVEMGALPIAEVLAAGAGIASALSAVHRAGLIHRDVKPANIVDAGGVYKLIDFGIAWEEQGDAVAMPVLVDDLPLELSQEEKSKISGAMTMRNVLALTGSATHTASLLHSGTVGYVDPACVRRAQKATAASDLYALGIVLFECATGQHPAAIASAQGEGLKQAVLDGTERAVSLSKAAPDLPKAFCDLVDRMLDPEPSARPRSADWVAVELERIRGELAGKKRELPPEAVGPFRGMGRFESTDRSIYFGRSSEVAAALELLRTNGLVSLVGNSGSGKSSLARAGVLPRVEDGALGRGVDVWDTIVVSPGPDPKRAILAALSRLPTGGSTDLMFEPMLEPADVVALLAERAQATGRGTLLCVDQLEELVTLQDNAFAASRKWATDVLAAFGESPAPGVRALVTARRDLLDPLLALSGLGKLLVRGTLLVEPLTDASWSEVIKQALEAYGYELEAGLADILLLQLKGTAGAMPLVGFALSELWEKRDRSSKVITRQSLEAIGGISGSLDRHADRTVFELSRSNAQAEAIVRELLLALTTPQGTRATVAPEALAKGGADHRAVLDALEQARLITVGGDGVTLAHDALLEQWQRLRRWLAEVREQRLLADEIEREASRYDTDPSSVALWTKRRLAQARELQRDAPIQLSKRAARFIEASRRAERSWRVAIAATLTLLLGLGAASAVSYARAMRADERSARERAEHAEQTAKLEQEKRSELEALQASLDEKHRRIDGLVLELEKVKNDPEKAAALAATIAEEGEQARAVQRKIIVATNAGPPKPTKSAEPPPSAKPTRPSIQREDD